MTLLFTGCGVATTDSPEPEAAEAEVVEEAPVYVGTWLRQGTYVDGVNVHSEPATLIIETDSYHSETDVCWVEGEVITNETDFTMTILEGDCPVVPGYESITYTKEFSEDLNEMTLETVVMGTTVMEIYNRAEETEESED